VPASVRAERARELLQKKKYLNAQLDRFQMAKAKAICDQIEALFLELSQINEELSAAELGRIRGVVQERQLLLKINLVKKELQSGV
jgi:DNA polymerase/3'-5' exonuclease PolX